MRDPHVKTLFPRLRPLILGNADPPISIVLVVVLVLVLDLV